MKKAIYGLLLALSAVLFQAAPASAGVSCSLPFTFQNGPGHPADATQVMANYNALVACLGQSAAAGANNDITSLSGLSNGVSNAGLAQMPASTEKCNPTSSTANAQDCPRSILSIMDFCTPTQAATDITSCAAAANTAANVGGTGVLSTQRRTIFFPARYSPYVSLSALTFNTSIMGEGKTDQIQCSNAVTTSCVTLSTPQSGSSVQGHLSAEDIGIGFSGTPGASAIALKVATTYSTTLRQVMLSNAAVGVEAVATGIYGITLNMFGVETCQMTDAHFVMDGWPEARITQTRFGCNGDGVNSNDFIRLQNTQGGPVNSPNTLYVNNSQFNVGGGQVGCLLHFVGLTSSNQNEWNLAGNHVEATTSGLCSDATTTQINRLTLTGNFFLDNSSSHDFFGSLNAATTASDWVLTGNEWASWKLTLAPSAQINNLVMTGNRFNSAQLAITGASNSTIDLEGNYYSGITLAGSFAASKALGANVGGTVSNTATGPIQFINPTAWTPAIAFGGGSTGVTYTTQTGQWQFSGDVVTYSFQITLSAVGSSTGAATITGLPLTCGNIGTAAVYNTGMASLTGAPLAVSSGASFNLYQTGATGVGTLSNSNFTATSSIQGTLTCFH